MNTQTLMYQVDEDIDLGTTRHGKIQQRAGCRRLQGLRATTLWVFVDGNGTQVRIDEPLQACQVTTHDGAMDWEPVAMNKRRRHGENDERGDDKSIRYQQTQLLARKATNCSTDNACIPSQEMI
jgi:hypothetical protein